MTIEPRRKLSTPVIVLLVVAVLAIPLIGVFAGITVFAVGGLQERNGGRDGTACAQELATVRTAVAAHVAEHDAAPRSDEDLVPMYITAPSPNYDLEQVGSNTIVVLQPGSPCPPPPEQPTDDESTTGATAWSREHGTVAEGTPEYCEIQRQTLVTALTAYGVDAGTPEEPRYPDTLDELLAAGFIHGQPSPGWVYTSDGTSYTLSGNC